MTRDETLALFAQGKEAWNAWAEARLNEKAAMETAGTWAAEENAKGEIEPKNDATRAWMAAVRAEFCDLVFGPGGIGTGTVTREGRPDFSSIVFPGQADFCGARFGVSAKFNDAIVFGAARFDKATFTEYAFFNRATFSGKADFDDVAFASDASFGEAQFLGLTSFERTRFRGDAWFYRVVFSRSAFFRQAEFARDVTFKDAEFHNGAFFDDALVAAGAEFEGVKFSWGASFENAAFSGDTQFHGALHSGDAMFAGATFKGNMEFYKATFKGLAGFGGVTFEQDARFDGAMFDGLAGFGRVTFKGGAGFDGARFNGDAGFAQAVFEGFASFEGATFAQEASFVAIHGRERSTFSLRQATFAVVPDFEQAHFSEAPQLDDSRIRDRSRTKWGGEANLPPRLAPFKQSDRTAPGGVEKAAEVKANLTSRWRALKRLAVQGHDHEREQAYFAEEIKSLRGVTDFALPRPLNLFLKGQSFWPGGARYWMGVLYQTFSDFGRSMVRPLAWWALLTVLFAFVYLGQHFVRREPGYTFSMLDWVALKSVRSGPALACLKGTASDPVASALYLSVHKGSLIAGLGGSDKLTQAYACLYGEDTSFGELAKQQLIPVIPDAVVFWSLGQTILSAALIFLFLLAVRSHFRIK